MRLAADNCCVLYGDFQIIGVQLQGVTSDYIYIIREERHRCGRRFLGCQLQASHFEGAGLRDANFTAADLRGASLKGTKLGQAKFAQANLCGLPLSGGASKAPDLSGCNATDEQFAQAIFDQPATALSLKSAA